MIGGRVEMISSGAFLLSPPVYPVSNMVSDHICVGSALVIASIAVIAVIAVSD